MGKLFISFRSSDTREAARSIFQSLSQSFGRDSIFYFPESNIAGDRFEEKIFSSLDQTDLVIAVIGASYTNVDPETNRSRILENDDLVRRELSYALARQITVIPVLIGRDHLPKKSELPSDLHDLHNLDFQIIDFNRGYDFGIAKLTDVIRHHVPSLRPRKRKPILWIGISIIFCSAIVYFSLPFVSGGSDKTGQPIVSQVDTSNTGSSIIQLSVSKKPVSEEIKKSVPTTQYTTTKIAPEEDPLQISAPAQLGIVQIGTNTHYDFTNTIASYFSKAGVKVETSVLSSTFQRKHRDDLKAGNLTLLKKSEVTDRMPCICLFDQFIEVSEKTMGSSPYVSMTLNGELLFTNLESGFVQSEIVALNGAGKSIDQAVQDLKRKFNLFLDDHPLPFQSCQ